METRDLINAIAADAKRPGLSFRMEWTVWPAVALAVAALTFFVTLGLRPDFDQAATTARFVAKFVFMGALAGSAYPVLRALARPDGRPAHYSWALLAGPVLLAGAIVLELMSVPQAEWTSRLVGSNSNLCLTFIPLIGIGPLLVFLGVLRHDAPTHPRMAGAFAGVVSGGIAAFFYAAQCTDDSPLFVAVWYSIAIAVLALAGALVAPRVTRW